MINIIKSKKGFSLPEILVVMTVIAIITVVTMNIFNNQRTFVQYDQEVIKVNSLIKLARNYASVNRSTYNGSESFVPAEGYGIYFERSNVPGESRMILFANTNADEGTPEALQYDKDDIVEEEFVMAQEAILEDITFTEMASPPVDTVVDRGVIFFQINSAQVSLYDNGDPENITDSPTEFDKLTVDFIRLGDDTGNSRKTFTIDKISGLPEMSL